MKHNQYFAGLMKETDDDLIVGKVVHDKDDGYLLYIKDEDDCRSWNSFEYNPSKKLEGFTHYTEVDDDEFSNYENYGLFAFTTISKQKYESLLKNKKERTSLEKELQKKYILGEVVDQTVRKIGDQYVFGCGSVSLDKKTMTALTNSVEVLLKTKERYEDIDGEIEELEAERDKIDTDIDKGWDKINKAVDNQLSHESIDLDNFDDVQITQLRKILAK